MIYGPGQHFTLELGLVEEGLNQIWSKLCSCMPSMPLNLSLTDSTYTDLDPDNELKHNTNPDNFIFLFFI